jgi:hypothetical protein
MALKKPFRARGEMAIMVGGYCSSGAGDVEALVHLVVKEAAAGGVGLKPFAIDDELGDGALAYVADQFVGGGAVGVDVDLGVLDSVRFQKLLGCTAISAPGSRVNLNLHI